MFVVKLGGVGIVTLINRLKAGRIYAQATEARTRAANFQGLYINQLNTLSLSQTLDCVVIFYILRASRVHLY
jgi:hypothetical protein